ncbi:MAG: hypothetical protein Q7S40_02855 [Opitutaceae bacterium]|nr:hypothetical protein [Opitutaceae bacterium]
MSLTWKIDECAEYYGGIVLRGWCHHTPQRIVGVSAVFPGEPTVVAVGSFGRPSPDVAAVLGEPAANCRFDEWLPVPAEAIGRDFYLRFFLDDQTTVLSGSALVNATNGDPYAFCWSRFLEHLKRLPAGTVLEIGSRARSAITRREQIPPHLAYVGMDILPGPNVDVVGDAHELASLLGRGRFSAAFSFSVFEHLAMPWKVALELNHVLAVGGLVYTSTHQTWPVHEEPWDFWRFSSTSWQTLFNAATGFEVMEAVCGEPARIHAYRAQANTRGMHLCPAYLGCAAIVRKISDTALSWPVPRDVATAGMYPSGESSNAPR